MNWDEFEKKVRRIASYRWNCNATTETIAGVKCDCVLSPEMESRIIIEITTENSINKVRDDIIKLRTVRNDLVNKDYYTKCYMVMSDKPTDSMRLAGKEQKIHVMSFDEFQNEYFDYNSYIHIRSKKQFGSLINLETGEPEINKYIDVSYYDRHNNRELNIENIIELLKNGHRIILKGDFGLGKSRCVKQIFDSLTGNPHDNPYAIAINLREHWGAKRCNEILTRHFEELGLDIKEFIKSYNQENIIYLLDGFDEIGTQSWSSDKMKMQHIREISVCALKDLIQTVRGGVLITGREYYFNSDAELLRCLGLDSNKTIILECHQEFTDKQLLAFLSANAPDANNEELLEELPLWFPRRPLIVQLLLKYASDIFSTEFALDGIYGFWCAFLNKICEREAKIYPALNPEVIKGVLIYLASLTRNSANNVGPISQQELSDAFIAVAGFAPNDESAIMLQRLPSIGRISADSPDRQFLDTFILDGLRAESIIQLCKSWNDDIVVNEWKNPLEQVGLSMLSEYISNNTQPISNFIAAAKKAANAKNPVLASDIISALCLLDIDSIDFRDIFIKDSHFSCLTFEGKKISRLTIDNSIIERLDLTNSNLDNNVIIHKCIISELYGIASRKSIPEQIVSCDVEKYEALATTTLIKRARLSEAQKLFVEMIRKIFYQPGAGRKEAALLRGMGASVNKKLSEKILSILLDEGLVTRIKGDEGYVYKPVRNKTGRVDKMLTDLTLSTDPIWLRITELCKS